MQNGPKMMPGVALGVPRGSQGVLGESPGVHWECLWASGGALGVPQGSLGVLGESPGVHWESLEGLRGSLSEILDLFGRPF